MQRVMIERLNQPHRVTANSFLIRLHCLRKMYFQKTLIYLFGLDFILRVMKLPLPLIYLMVSYGDEWIIILYILF
jgi:hypothetical protein